MERRCDITLLYLPASLEDLCREWKREDKECVRERSHLISLKEVSSSVLLYRAHNPSPSPNLRAMFRPLNICLTVSFPSGARPIPLNVRRNIDEEGLFLEVDTQSVQDLPKHTQREYLLAACDFARSIGCTRVRLPKQCCLLVMK